MNKAVSGAKAHAAKPIPKETVVAAFGWILAVLLAGVVASRAVIPIGLTAGAVAVGVLPGLTTLLLARRTHEAWARVFIVFAWIGFAAAAMGVTGGFASPLAASFILAPAIALRIGGRREIAEAAFFAALGFAVTGFVAGPGAPPLALGPLPPMAAGVSLIIAGILLADGGEPRIVVAPAAPRDADDLTPAQRQRVAELAHEMRTPLTHILGFTDLMRQRLFGPMHERYGEYVDLIHTSGRNLLDLAEGLLDLSRLESGRYPLAAEPFDFHDRAEECVQLARLQAEQKSIALILDADETLPVNADARALRQILTNLIANAIKFTPANGRVIARAKARGRDLVLEVEDNGPGIPAAERTRLGAAFERGAAASRAEGYGLGLSLVRAFAAAHHGVLSFHEAPGGGALVRVTLPVMR